MNKGAVFMSCFGALMVIFNKPLASACHLVGVTYSNTDLGLRPYRVTFIIFGALLVLGGAAGVIVGDS
jgi:hypothetical protein